MQRFIVPLTVLFHLAFSATFCNGQATVHSERTVDSTVYKLDDSKSEQVGWTRHFHVTAGSDKEDDEMIRVDDNDDGGSKWTGTKSGATADFHGVQKKDVSGHFTPTFTGRARVLGSGPGPVKEFEWVAFAQYKIIAVEIHRSVAGGAFKKISDEQNVDPVIVGQKVELKVVVKPDGLQFTNQWSINGGMPIKDYSPTKNSAQVVDIPNDDKTKQVITFYHTDSGNANISVAVTYGEQQHQVTKTASYGILRPTVNKFEADWTVRNPKVGLWYFLNSPLLGLSLGGATQPNSNKYSSGILWRSQVTPPQGGGGTIAYLNLYKNGKRKCIDLGGKPHTMPSKSPLLDTSFPFNLKLDVATQVLSAELVDKDTCFEELNNQIIAQEVEDHFIVYLMFKPDGTGSIWVTLGEMPWGWNGKAARTGAMNNGTGGWELEPNPNPIEGGNADKNSAKLPTWIGNLKDETYN